MRLKRFDRTVFRRLRFLPNRLHEIPDGAQTGSGRVRVSVVDALTNFLSERGQGQVSCLAPQALGFGQY
jgi:hypothetical protein